MLTVGDTGTGGDFVADPFMIEEVGTQSGEWNDEQMHHLDAMMPFAGGPPVAAVDGRQSGTWSSGIYTLGDGSALSAVLATPPTNPTISSGTSWTQVPMDSYVWAEDELLDTVAGEFVAPTSGWYKLAAKFRWGGFSAAAQTRSRVHNTTQGEELALDDAHVGSGENVTNITTTEVHLNKGDHVAVDAQHDSGSDETVAGGKQNSLLLSRRIR